MIAQKNLFMFASRENHFEEHFAKTEEMETVNEFFDLFPMMRSRVAEDL